MKKRPILATLIGLLILIGGIGLSACASSAFAGQKGGADSYIATSVAATLVQHMIETDVAAQSTALFGAPVAQVQATTQPPTPTLAATATPLPTLAPTDVPTAIPPTLAQPTALPASVTFPTITADQNTNCRVGPGTRYAVASGFLKGAVSTVQGRDTTKDWWYIVSPTTPGQFCWVWDGSTTVVGDTSTLPVVNASVADVYASNTYDPYDGYDPSGYGWYGYGFYGYNNCQSWPSYCCGKKNCCINKCCNNNNWQGCNWGDWWNCGSCGCAPVFNYNPCKHSNCPPVTEVNYKNYCKKYPKCCDQ